MVTQLLMLSRQLDSGISTLDDASGVSEPARLIQFSPFIYSRLDTKSLPQLLVYTVVQWVDSIAYIRQEWFRVSRFF